MLLEVPLDSGFAASDHVCWSDGQRRRGHILEDANIAHNRELIVIDPDDQYEITVASFLLRVIETLARRDGEVLDR